MPEDSTTPDLSGSLRATDEQRTVLQSETSPPEKRVSGRSRGRGLSARGADVVGRIGTSAPGKYWSQLTAVDFLNSSFAFAALAVVSAFPFLAVVSAAAGAGGVRQAIVTRMGLNAQASRDVDSLISSGHEISTLTAFSAVLLVLGAFGMASTLQAWYQKIYDQPSPPSILRRLAYQAVGIVAFSAYITVNVYVLHEAHRVGRGLVSP